MNQTNHPSDHVSEEQGQPRVFNGEVASIKALDRLNAQIQLKGINQVFRLSVSSEWFLSKGDRVSLVGEKNEQGVWVCFAYRNHSMGVEGQKETIPPVLGFGIVLFGAILFVPGLIIAFGDSFGVGVMLPGLAIMTAGFGVFMITKRLKARIKQQTSLLDSQASSESEDDQIQNS